MINTVKPLQLSFNQQVLEHGGRFHFIASVTQGIRLSSGQALLETDFLKEAIENMGVNPLPDVGMPKPCGEFLVSGSFFAPQQQPVTGGEVRVRVGAQQKTLYVFGPRQWVMGIPSAPELITEVALEYTNAYGGNGLSTNPDGIGYQQEDLPLIENPEQLLTSANARIEPAGLGVLNPACAQRMRYCGTYDDQYLTKFFPGYPDDFDWQFFLAAAHDQRCEGYYRGDEDYEFHNLHPQQAVIRGQLPGYLTRCFVRQKVQGGLRFSELKLNLDTLWFFPHSDLALQIWRGGIAVTDDEAEQISDIVLAYERQSNPRRDSAYYERALQRRLDSDDVLLNNFNTLDLIPPGELCAMQIFQRDALGSNDSSAFSNNLDAKIDVTQKMVEEKTAELKKQVDDERARVQSSDPELDKKIDELLNTKASLTSADPDVEAMKARLEALLPGITRGDPAKIDLTQFSFDKIEKIMAEVQALIQSKTDHAKKTLDEASAAIQSEAANGLRGLGQTDVANDDSVKKIDDMLQKLKQQDESDNVLAPLPRLDAKKIMAEFSQFDPNLTEAMQNLQSMKAAGIDNASTQTMEQMIQDALQQQDHDLEESLFEAQASFKQAYMMGAHRMRNGGSPHNEQLAQVAERFIAMVSRRQSVADQDWACIDLRGRVLDNIDLSNCYLEQVDFSGASLRNANLRGAILARATLNKADLSGADLSGANLGGIRAHGANFTHALFRDCKMSLSDFTRANLSHSTMENVESLEIVINHADFSQAHIKKLKLIELDLKGTNFHAAEIEESAFIQCTLQDIDFSEANLPTCVWADVLFEDVSFERANMSKNCFVATAPENTRMTRVSFNQANLSGSNLQNMHMAKCRFVDSVLDDAIMNGADLRQSNLSGASAINTQFRKANLEHSQLHQVNLMQGSLAKARLSGASLQGSNLYSVDFLRSVVGETDFSGCNLSNTLLQDWRP